ncbi:MAG: hypothetical protein U0166_11665 [Acidobacteriota bacterium]
MMELERYQSALNDFEQLSLKDLLAARDMNHAQLMRHANVVATAVGRYRIRKEDSWPGRDSGGKRHGTGPRTLENSEVRPYSWPCVLVFVERWVSVRQFSESGEYHPDELVPRSLYMPDGRRVPVCVIEAPRELESAPAPIDVRYPLNNVGGGNPVIAQVQGRQYVATIACLVTDGHKTYALTNRHVTGAPGEVLYSLLGGKLQRIGTTAPGQLTRLPFGDLYPGWSGKSVYVNLDVGLIDIDNLDLWTAQVREVGTVGPLADLAVDNLSLGLVGCHVRGYGSGSGQMLGEIHALFYRYKSVGGFEYVADFMIGPRSASSRRRAAAFSTRPGDSGTLWLLEAPQPRDQGRAGSRKSDRAPLLPLAVQWGAHAFKLEGARAPQAYALATCLSSVCSLLGVDVVRDWGLDEPDTWGAVGHFAIAARTPVALSGKFPRLATLVRHNILRITHDDSTILTSAFKGLGAEPIVRLADVPDFFWKHGEQHATRPLEGPNHFADMDQKRPSDGLDLLALCKDPENVDPDVWNAFYDSLSDLLTGEPIAQRHRGLLPFRAWQIFDEMVTFASDGKAIEFVCAAGVLAHYIGDACQPLHISYLHDGDPEQAVTRTVHHHDGTEEEVKEPLGIGVHAAYEDDMVNAHRQEILAGLDKTPVVDTAISNGKEAALRTVALMASTHKRLPPRRIVDAFLEFDGNKADRPAFLWKRFGAKTIRCMRAGANLLATLWESAWAAGGGEAHVPTTKTFKGSAIMDTCRNPKFLESLSIARIGQVLKKP